MKRIIIAFFALILLSSCGGKNKASLDDKDALLKFAYQYLQKNSEGEVLSKDEFFAENSVTQLVHDFNRDGEDDVLIYSDYINNPEFYNVIIVTVENGKYTILPSEIKEDIGYSQSFKIENGFLIRNIVSGGIDVKAEYNYVYEIAKDNVYDSGEMFYKKTESSFQGNSYLLTGKKTGDWNSFIYNISTKNVDTLENMGFSEIKYFYNKSTHKYNKHTISKFEIADEEYIYPREKVSQEDFANTDFHKRVPNAPYSSYIESNENRMLTGFEPETFGEQNINYDDYYTVVIPMYTSINNKFAQKRVVSFNIDSKKQFKVTVFGELQDVAFSQTDLNGTVQKLENFSESPNIINTEITINADADSVLLTGRIHKGEGIFKDVNIILSNKEKQTVVTNK